MLLFVVAYLGGVLTILSPCILPVLPFVFARGDQPFLKSGLPLLLGMALTFAGVASLAAVGGGWAVQANQYGRDVAIVLMALFGVTLLLPQLAERLTRPLVSWGERLSASAEGDGRSGGRSSFVTSLLLGVATGLLWAPCAGPILGLVLTGAALGGASAQTSLLLLAYAAGAATSLAGALLIGGRLFKAMKKSLGAGEWIRRGIGVALLCGVAAIALGLDTGVLAQLSLAGTSTVEQALIDKVRPRKPAEPPAEEPVVVTAGPGSTVMMAGSNGQRHDGRQQFDDDVRRQGRPRGLARRRHGPLAGRRRAMAQLAAAHHGRPARQGRAGRLLDLLLHQLPARAAVRAGLGREVQGQGPGGDRRACAGVRFREGHRQRAQGRGGPEASLPGGRGQRVRDLARLQQRVLAGALFHRRAGPHPAPPFRRGQAYDQSEQVIRQLLAEAGQDADAAGDLVKVEAQGAQAAADSAQREVARDLHRLRAAPRTSRRPAAWCSASRTRMPCPPGNCRPTSGRWAATGPWASRAPCSARRRAASPTAFTRATCTWCSARHTDQGRPVRIKVTIDGKPPGEDHGVDVDAQGLGTVDGQRLYQLVRQRGAVADRRFEIEFLDPGAEAFAFTFG
jgi:cytochrome c biogenesis protein CcdA